MAFNLKNPNNIMLGTGILYVNGVDVGILKGNVTFKYIPEYQEIKGGSPEQTIRKDLISETATLTAGIMEISPDTIGTLMPNLFTPGVQASGTAEVVYEYIGSINALRWSALAHNKLTVDAVSVRKAAKLAAGASAGATKIYVENATLFAAGDTITLKDGSTTENATIAALGVDTSENSLTITEALSNTYSLNAICVNTADALVDGTDFYTNRIDGQIARVPSSIAIDDGDTVAVSYKHTTITAQTLKAGGKLLSSFYPMRFEADRRDGKKWVLEFYRAQLSGDFEMAFQPSDAMVLNVEISALADSSRSDGEQLFSLSLVTA